MAYAKDVAAKESTATLNFHPSRVGSGMGYRKRGTLGGRAIGGVNASAVRTMRLKVPWNSWWSRKAVWTVTVSSVWREMRWGTYIVRCVVNI